MFNQKRTEKSIPSLMDISMRKPKPVYKNYKTNFQHNHQFEGGNYSAAPSHSYFKPTRIQNHSLKWKKNHHYKGNCRAVNHPYRKNNVTIKKVNKSAEDAEEEERKKKLNDTAKKLLNKIKTWNAEKSVKEPTKSNVESEQSDVNELQKECSVSVEEKSESKKRIAHSKKGKLVKSRTVKRLKQPAKATAKYDVNKTTVKDFQNRIQHKLIEEIMQMPKENLQSVLNDPKINPIMDLKMSRLVQENRPLITQKLRALAESKMKNLGSTSNPQLLVDIDKLIDPVIETDLSALPYELIKQMENLFQVQFDYSPDSSSQRIRNSTDEQQQNDFLDNLHGSTLAEDLSLYECSTDEDEDVSASNDFCEQFFTSSVDERPTGEDIDRKNELIVSRDSETFSGESTVMSYSNESESERPTAEPPEEPSPKVTSSKSYATVSSQTNSETHSNVSTQTSEEMPFLYGVSLPTESKDGSASSLLEEVNAIQILTSKLNERRLKIFLQLSRMNPDGDFVSDERTRGNLMETLSNGSVCLMNSLEEFFNVRCKKNQKNSQVKSNDNKFNKSNKKWANRNNKTRNKEER